MLEFVSAEEIEGLDDPYYEGRWGYLHDAADLVFSIPEAPELGPADVLELGAYRLSLVRGCDTMDRLIHDRSRPPSCLHDARLIPWPIGPDRYRLFVALQVWEHLAGRQREAFSEVERVARWAILSVPYCWPGNRLEDDHAQIDLATLRGWTGRDPVAMRIVRSAACDRERLLALYNLRDGGAGR